MPQKRIIFLYSFLFPGFFIIEIQVNEEERSRSFP